jgi:predicted  nucleic acid-binding Zn-ribbon protein
MQVKTSVEERLATLEQAIKSLETYIRDDTKRDIGKLEQYLREYDEGHEADIEKLRDDIIKSSCRCDRTFRWMIGIFTTAFVSLVMLVVLLCSF